MPPEMPDAATCEHLLDVLAELVARSGPAPLLLAPVEPGPEAFPDAWAPNASGVTLLLRRLAWHAGVDREIKVQSELAGAPPDERKPMTRVELVEVGPRSASFVLHYVGDDDVAGALAHEIGVAHAVLHRHGRDPYRAADDPVVAVDPELDLERGSIATVYLGLGTLAANASRQHHSVMERQGFNPMFVAPTGATVEAGHVSIDSLAYLLAVQAVVRGVAEPPPGLTPEQRRAVDAWLDALRDRRAELRERLGITADAESLAARERPEVVRFDDEVVSDDAPRKTAFRWRTNRAGIGTLAGGVLGLGIAMIAVVSTGGLAGIMIGGAVGGHILGRGVRVVRCSGCATPLPEGATSCTRCGATLRGDIASLSERLDAEERLESENR